MRRRAIPLADARRLAVPARRTRILRVLLAATLIGALAAVYVGSRDTKKGGELLPSNRSTIVAIDLSWSVSYDNYRQIERTLSDLANSGRHLGLVLFSDVAYEALPPGTPAAEVKPYLRFFRTRGTPNPWSDSFAGGTRIWTALALARRMLHRDRITNGTVVLISDLADAPNDRAELGQTLVSYARDSIPIRIVGLDPTPEDESLFRGALAHGGGSVTTEHPPTYEPPVLRASPAFPVVVVAAVGLIAFLLGVNEHFLGSLGWGRRRDA